VAIDHTQLLRHNKRLSHPLCRAEALVDIHKEFASLLAADEVP